MKKWILLSLLIALPLLVSAASPINWKPVGAGDMRWTFFKLYRIQLFSDTGSYTKDSPPQALEITYYRDLSSAILVEATADQWKHLGVSNDSIEDWLLKLEELWPDIKKGEQLRFEVDADNKNRFFHNGLPLGGIEDKDFSTAFLNIWLSPKSSAAKLRQQLITAP